MGDDDLPFAQEFIGHADSFAQQSAGILAQVQNEALEVSELVQGGGHFMLGGLLEIGDVHITNARTNHQVHVYAVTRNLIPHHVKLQRLLGTFAQYRNLDP